MSTDTQQAALDAFFLDWIERMERLREERKRDIALAFLEPSGAAS